MELILFPIMALVQFTAYILMAIVGLLFNVIFRRDRVSLLDKDNPPGAKPQNPWEVFFYSLSATLILALLGSGLSYYLWESSSAALTGFIVVGVFGIFASITAATGEAPPM